MSTKLQPGDRIRITFEGEVRRRYISGELDVKFDGGSDLTTLEPGEVAAATIEVISQSFKIDDKAAHHSGGTDNVAIVKGVDGDRVWVRWPSGAYADAPSKNFRRVEP